MKRLTILILALALNGCAHVNYYYNCSAESWNRCIAFKVPPQACGCIKSDPAPYQDENWK